MFRFPQTLTMITNFVSISHADRVAKFPSSCLSSSIIASCAGCSRQASAAVAVYQGVETITKKTSQSPLHQTHVSQIILSNEHSPSQIFVFHAQLKLCTRGSWDSQPQNKRRRWAYAYFTKLWSLCKQRIDEEPPGGCWVICDLLSDSRD